MGLCASVFISSREKLRLWGTSPYLSRRWTVFFSVHSNLPPFITFCIDMLLLTNRESIFVVDSNIYIVVDRTHREWVAEPTTLTRASPQVERILAVDGYLGRISRCSFPLKDLVPDLTVFVDRVCMILVVTLAPSRNSDTSFVL